MLLAFVLGIECRVGNAVSPGQYRRGSTCGVFGTAAAVAKALDLAIERILWTFGNASAHAGGLLETLGSMSKSLSVGNAARNGFASALFAREGVSGPARPLAILPDVPSVIEAGLPSTRRRSSGRGRRRQAPRPPSSAS